MFILTSYFLYSKDWAAVVNQYGDAVCKIEICSGDKIITTGSGFTINSTGSILTNYHVISKAVTDSRMDIKVSFPQSEDQEKSFSAIIGANSAREDLALISIEKETSVFLQFHKGNSPELMTEVMVMGFPLGQGFKSTPGYIQAFQENPGLGYMYDLSIGVDPGNSGGPVIDVHGSIVGVVTAHIPGYNFNLALPLDSVKGFIDRADNPHVVEINSNPEGSRIFINGRYKGTTPISIDFYGSKVKLRIEHDSYQAEEKVLSPDFQGPLMVELKKIISQEVKVRLDTNPSGAEIWVDNIEMGESPLEFEVDPGSRIRVRSKLRWHKPRLDVIKIGNDPEQEIILDLD